MEIDILILILELLGSIIVGIISYKDIKNLKQILELSAIAPAIIFVLVMTKQGIMDLPNFINALIIQVQTILIAYLSSLILIPITTIITKIVKHFLKYRNLN